MSGSNASTAGPNDGFGGSSDGDSHPICRLQGADKSVGCNHTLYQGHCGHLYSPVDGKWCTHPEENFDLCCAESDTDCCKPSTSWTVAFATFLLLALGCICCMYLYRMVFRFRQSLFSSRRVPENPRRRSANDPGDSRDNRDVRQTESASFRRRLPSHDEQEQFELKLRDHIRLVFTDQDDASDGADGDDAQDKHTDGKDCIICYTRPRQVVLACGHSQMCLECVENLIGMGHACPTCRVPISNYAHLEAQPSFRDLSGLMPPSPSSATTTSAANARSSNRTSTQIFSSPFNLPFMSTANAAATPGHSATSPAPHERNSNSGEQLTDVATEMQPYGDGRDNDDDDDVDQATSGSDVNHDVMVASSEPASFAPPTPVNPWPLEEVREDVTPSSVAEAGVQAVDDGDDAGAGMGADQGDVDELGDANDPGDDVGDERPSGPASV